MASVISPLLALHLAEVGWGSLMKKSKSGGEMTLLRAASGGKTALETPDGTTSVWDLLVGLISPEVPMHSTLRNLGFHPWNLELALGSVCGSAEVPMQVFTPRS